MIRIAKWIMSGLSVVFWVLGLIPVVNIFTNIIWWLIWALVWGFVVAKVIVTHPVRFFVALIIIIPAIILGFIPFINWIPWTAAATWASFHIMDIPQVGNKIPSKK